MTNTPPAPLIPHSRNCKRPAPTLRLSWAQTAELHCPGCGRAVAAPAPTPGDDAARLDRQLLDFADDLTDDEIEAIHAGWRLDDLDVLPRPHAPPANRPHEPPVDMSTIQSQPTERHSNDD